jgi:predicted ester cyclase
MNARQFRFVIFFLCAVLLLIATGCENQSKKAELDKCKATVKTQEQNKEIVREIFAAIDGDINKLGVLLSDDFSLYVSGTLQPYKKEDLIKLRNAHYEAFPDWIHKIEDLIAEGDRVVVKLTQYGTHKAKYKGIEPTGKYVTVPAIHILNIVNGKAKEWWGVEDNLGLMRQLGMELKPEEEKK